MHLENGKSKRSRVYCNPRLPLTTNYLLHMGDVCALVMVGVALLTNLVPDICMLHAGSGSLNSSLNCAARLWCYSESSLNEPCVCGHAYIQYPWKIETNMCLDRRISISGIDR